MFPKTAVWIALAILGVATTTWLCLPGISATREVDAPAIQGDTGLNFIRIAPGSFTMGSRNESLEELPLTEVTLTQSYWLCATEVSRGQWRRFAGTDTPIRKKSENPDDALPALLTLVEAREFCSRLEERLKTQGRLPAGWTVTLPSEAQWEYAAGAGEPERPVTPEAYMKSLYARDDEASALRPVATRAPNPWGFFDLIDNADEWCDDLYAAYPGGRMSDPAGPEPGDRLPMTRGGSRSRRHEIAYTRHDEHVAAVRPVLSQIQAATKAAAPDSAPPAPSAAPPRLASPRVLSGSTITNAPLTSGHDFRLTRHAATWLRIAPGEFLMGSDAATPAERPITRVTIKDEYWLGATEVTRNQWQIVMGQAQDTDNLTPESLHTPVEVTWQDAKTYCQALTRRMNAAKLLPAGYRVDLPSEEEWEYAATAGGAGAPEPFADYAWASDPTDLINERIEPHPVAGKRPNPWGFYDMQGNVAEWCARPFRFYAEPASAHGHAVHPPLRVTRGGRFTDRPAYCAPSIRGIVSETNIPTAGFRTVITRRPD